MHFYAILLALPVWLTITGTAIAQTKVQITGQVTEAGTNEPLPGVSILIRGTTTGTITDIGGNYSLEALTTDVLVFSYMGYLNEQAQVGTRTVINVSLVQDIIGLDEVIVTGYGVQRKSDLTGVIASVSGEELTKVPGATVDEALKGRAAGVFSSTESGAPGSNPVIRIRGIGSMNAGDPLIIIDGVPSSIYALSSINPNDIKSMEILKDASSQAIYGASGGNGVILISTKQGDPKKLTTEVGYYFGLQNPHKVVDVLNTEEFFSVYNSLDIPETVRLGWSDDTIATLPDIDWQRELLRNAPMHNVNLAISGGSEKSTYRFSTSYFYQDGVVPNSKYQRFTARLNSLHSVTKRIKIGENVSLSNEKYTGFPDYYYNDAWASPVAMAALMHPFVEPYNTELKWNNWNPSPIGNLRNPFMYVDITDREIPSYRFSGDLNMTVDILKGLTYKTILGGGLDFGWTRNFTPIYYYSPQLNNNRSSIQRQAWRNYSWNWQHTLTYYFSVQNHNFTLMGGFESGYYLNEGFSGTRLDLIDETRVMHYFSASLAEDGIILNDLDGSPQDVATMAYFGRINYDYRGLILLTSNIRRDYSSRFGPLYRDGYFPSVSVGLKFSEFDFVKNIGWLSFGKVRAGWGKMGNSGGALYPYRYYARVINTSVYNYALDNDNLYSGAATHGIANPELRWEAMKDNNFGIDLTFLNNRLSLSADYFIKGNDGMIIEQPTPDFAGTFQENAGAEGGSTSLVANAGEFKTTGIEVTAGFKNVKGLFRHNLNVNFSYVENEVVDIGGDTIITGSAQFYSNLTFTAEGQPIGQFYGWRTDGLFRPEDAEWRNGRYIVVNQPFTISDAGDTTFAQPRAQPGDVRFVDVNGDGTINPNDRTIIGNPHPKYLLGISYDLSYKMFDLSMFWQGAFGHDIMYITKTWLYNPTGAANWAGEVLDRYTDENTNADLYRLSYTDANDNDRMSDFFIESGSYLRLKNIQLGFTLPAKTVSRIGMSELRLYVGVKDLLTITNYPGVDPETAVSRNPLVTGIDFAAYPKPRVYTFGVNATF